MNDPFDARGLCCADQLTCVIHGLGLSIPCAIKPHPIRIDENIHAIKRGDQGLFRIEIKREGLDFAIERIRAIGWPVNVITSSPRSSNLSVMYFPEYEKAPVTAIFISISLFQNGQDFTDGRNPKIIELADSHGKMIDCIEEILQGLERSIKNIRSCSSMDPLPASRFSRVS